MKILGNALWHVLCLGFVIAIITYLLGLLLSVTVVGAPIGIGLMELGKFYFKPFSSSMISEKELAVERSSVWKFFSVIVYLLYFPVGLFLWIIGLAQVVVLFITLIGIPMALVVAKSLGTQFYPIGKKCVSSYLANALEEEKGRAAARELQEIREKNAKIQEKEGNS